MLDVRQQLELQHEIEQFLYREAALIDSRRYEEWVDLFTEDGIYWVPNSTEGNDDDPQEAPSILYQNRQAKLRHVQRLQFTVYEVPPPRTRHMITNVVITDGPDGDLLVTSNQVVYRIRLGRRDEYAGTWEHTLRRVGDAWRISRKKAFVIENDEALAPMPVL